MPRANGKFLIDDTIHYLEVWRQMVHLAKTTSLVKNVGICNVNVEQLTRICRETGMVPQVLQVECHPYLPQHELLNICKTYGIQFCAYSPLGKPERSKMCGYPVILEDATIKSLAMKYSKTPAQIILQWALSRGMVHKRDRHTAHVGNAGKKRAWAIWTCAVSVPKSVTFTESDRNRVVLKWF